MTLWKILSIISCLCLAVASYFAWDNRTLYRNEKELARRADADLASAQQRKTKADESQKNKVAQLDTKKKELDDLKIKVAKAASDAQEKQAALDLAKTNLAEVAKQVAELTKQIDEAGNIKELIAKVESLTKEKEAADGKLAAKNQELAIKQEALAGLQKEIGVYRDAEARARKGIVEPSFTARVSSAYPQWGFVILNKGNNNGVFANADLEVKKGSDVIAKLKVRNVEPLMSIADVVPGSLVEGKAVSSGDLVVAAPQTAPPPAPAGGGAAPAAPAAGGGGAPAPAPAAAMQTDPFAAPGGMAPAPAAPAADPFGAAPAPAAPAPGGAGTKGNPSTTDPFGGAAPAATPPAGGAPAAPAAEAKDPFGAAPPAPGGTTPPAPGGTTPPPAPPK